MKQKIITLSRSRLFQPFWEKLNHLSKIGMNYWGAGSFLISGELYIIEKILSDEKHCVFFDVGANNGQFAKRVSSILNGTSKIYCFEPLPSMFKVLSEETDGTENINKYNFGFGETEENLEIHYLKDREVLSSLYTIEDRHFTDSENVLIKTIDDFLSENNIPEITYLKIDVEGHELKVLEGAKEALENSKIKYIQFEFGESMIDARVFFRNFWDLLNESYTIHRILPDGIREIKEYSVELEVFHCVNFLAIHKTV